jgi:hypothetical protein
MFLPVLTFFLALSSHYGNPFEDGCLDDEIAVQVQGIDGAMCTPECGESFECPTDVPEGVTAVPTCALQSPDGEKYCALLCSPRQEGQCGEGSCQRAAPGTGICTYSRDSEKENFSFSASR